MASVAQFASRTWTNGCSMGNRVIPTHRSCRCSFSSSRRRVVVTGLGLVTPLGTGVPLVWQRLLDAHSGAQTITNPQIVRHNLPAKIAAYVPKCSPESSPASATLSLQTRPDGLFDIGAWVPAKTVPVTSQFVHFAMSAASQALVDAGWTDLTPAQQARTGVAVGSGIGGLEAISDTTLALEQRGYRRVSPYFIPRVLVNLAAGNISIQHCLRGPNHAAATACATGAHSIGDAARMIAHGDADVMVAGGTDSAIDPVTIAGFSRLRALSTKWNDEPQLASRPFNEHRDGFVLGEGAGAVVLEAEDHAQARGARVYAEVAGYGLSADAHHITAPPADAAGVQQCMSAALTDAGLSGADVDHVNAHATSTPLGDDVEAQAIATLLGSRAKEAYVCSTKGAIGHLLGGAGAVEAIFAIMALHTQTAPPTLNVFAGQEEPRQARNAAQQALWLSEEAVHAPMQVSLTNSFGFGGTNATLVFKRAAQAAGTRSR